MGPTRPPLPEFPSVSTKPKLRSFPDRLRQIAMFEIGGLVLITPALRLGERGADPTTPSACSRCWR